jgi:hypothetical protein
MAKDPSPEQAAGEGGQRRVEAYQMQALQLSLSRQQPIEDAVFRAAVGIAAPRKGCAATCFSPCAVRKPGQAGWRGDWDEARPTGMA